MSRVWPVKPNICGRSACSTERHGGRTPIKIMSKNSANVLMNTTGLDCNSKDLPSFSGTSVLI